MPPDLTIFAASYLIFLDAVLALGVLAWLWFRRPQPSMVGWALTVAIMLVLSLLFSRIGAGIHADPRPFTLDHVKPLISHPADNGFPSDHALLAAAIVAAVLLASPAWSVPFVVLGFLVDWARVGAGLHHVEDVVGSTLFVLLATVVAWLLAPPLAERLTPHLPAPLSGARVTASGGERDIERGAEDA